MTTTQQMEIQASHLLKCERVSALVYWHVHFQHNDVEWVFILQGGGMRRSGGYVD